MTIRNRRMISRTISTSEKLWKLKSFEAKLLFTWMILHCDDEGRMEGEPVVVKANVIPLEAISPEKVGEYLSEMNKTGLIRWYKVSKKRYIQLSNWETFQSFGGFHRNPSRFPSPSTPSRAVSTKRSFASPTKEYKEVKEVKEYKKEGNIAYAKNLKAIGHKIREAEN